MGEVATTGWSITGGVGAFSFTTGYLYHDGTTYSVGSGQFAYGGVPVPKTSFTFGLWASRINSRYTPEEIEGVAMDFDAVLGLGPGISVGTNGATVGRANVGLGFSIGPSYTVVSDPFSALPTLPSGSVSSMRSTEQIGSVIQGYETNALDVLGEQGGWEFYASLADKYAGYPEYPTVTKPEIPPVYSAGWMSQWDFSNTWGALTGARADSIEVLLRTPIGAPSGDRNVLRVPRGYENMSREEAERIANQIEKGWLQGLSENALAKAVVEGYDLNGPETVVDLPRAHYAGRGDGGSSYGNPDAGGTSAASGANRNTGTAQASSNPTGWHAIDIPASAHLPTPELTGAYRQSDSPAIPRSKPSANDRGDGGNRGNDNYSGGNSNPSGSSNNGGEVTRVATLIATTAVAAMVIAVAVRVRVSPTI